MSTDRDRLASIVRPMLPEAWRGRIEKHTVRALGTLSAPSVFLDFTTITHDGMPPGAVVDEFEVALVHPSTDYAKAEDDLDTTVRVLIDNLDDAPAVAWSRAEKRGIADYLAWVVTVQLISTTTDQE
ncbi:hypothetical protein [Microbacterium sp. GXF7504]